MFCMPIPTGPMKGSGNVCLSFLSCIYLHAVYVNRDKLTGFGTHWEIVFDSNHTVLTKGGNVRGYSALFVYVPELQLGKVSLDCTNIMKSKSRDHVVS